MYSFQPANEIINAYVINANVFRDSKSKESFTTLLPWPSEGLIRNLSYCWFVWLRTQKKLDGKNKLVNWFSSPLPTQLVFWEESPEVADEDTPWKWGRKESEHSRCKGRRAGIGFDVEVSIKKAWIQTGKLWCSQKANKWEGHCINIYSALLCIEARGHLGVYCEARSRVVSGLKNEAHIWKLHTWHIEVSSGTLLSLPLTTSSVKLKRDLKMLGLAVCLDCCLLCNHEDLRLSPQNTHEKLDMACL